MEIRFANAQQARIADLIWHSNSRAEAQSLVRLFGLDGEIVYSMILAASIDEELQAREEFPEVMEILEALK